MGILALANCACTLGQFSAGGGTPTFKVVNPPGHYSAESPKQTGGSVTVGEWQFPAPLSPVYSNPATATEVEQGIFDGLLRIDPSLHWLPDLATRLPTLDNGGVKLSPDGRSMEVVYDLRSGLQWSDGQPLTADDVVFTWKLISSAGSSVAGVAPGYAYVTSVVARSPSKVVVDFKAPYAAYPLLFDVVLPKHRLAAIDLAGLPADPYWRKPDVVSGPFTVQEATSDHYTLIRNSRYSAGRGNSGLLSHAAYLQRVVFKAYPTKPAMLAAAKVGDIDVALDLNERDLDALSSLTNERIRLSPSLQYEQVSFNQASPNAVINGPPPWAGDPNVLRALDLATNRPALLAGLLRKLSPAALGPISPYLGWAYDQSLNAPPYDPNQAGRILEQDGWRMGSQGVREKNGQRLVFALFSTTDQPLRAHEEDILVAGWKKVGAGVLIQNFSPAQLFASYGQGGIVARGLFEAGLWAWIPRPDPDSEFNLLHSSQIPSGTNPDGQNYSRCSDPKIDASLAQGRASLDQAQRGTAYHSFQQAYRQARCELPLYRRLDIAVVSPRLHNFVLNPAQAGSTWNLADWWLG